MKTFCMNSPLATRINQLKNDAFGVIFRLLIRDFVITGSHMVNYN